MNADKKMNLCLEVGTDRIGNYLNRVVEQEKSNHTYFQGHGEPMSGPGTA